MVYLNSSPCIEEMEFCINRYPICKERKCFGENKNKTQFSWVKNQSVVYQNE